MVNTSTKARKNVAGQAAPAAKRSTATMTGKLLDAALPSVTGRGRQAIPVPAELAANLAQALETGRGVSESGTQNELQRFKGLVTKWCEAQGNVKPAYRTLEGNFKTADMPASASITIGVWIQRQEVDANK